MVSTFRLSPPDSHSEPEELYSLMTKVECEGALGCQKLETSSEVDFF